MLPPAGDPQAERGRSAESEVPASKLVQQSEEGVRTTDDRRPSTVPTRGVSRDGPEREETGYVGVGVETGYVGVGWGVG